MKLKVEGYEIAHIVYSDMNSHLARAVHKVDGHECLLHVFPQLGDPHFQAIQHYYLRTRTFTHSSLVQYQKKIEGKDQIALVADLSRYNCLRRLLEEQNLSVDQFLLFADQLTTALKAVHDKGYSHGHIHLDSILINSQLNNVKWFSYTLQSDSLVSPQQQLCLAPEIIDKTLVSGDVRSDLYSLGLVFFQMLNGLIPDKDTALLVPFHNSLKNGEGLGHYFTPATPKPIQTLINRLLAPNPQERYQSCSQVLSELQDIADSPDSTGLKGSRHTLPIGLKHPAGIYGRDMEVLEVYRSYQMVLEGNTNFLAVSGYSGIGKTSVVDRAQQLYFSEFCLYAKGKFDQINRRIPYSAFLQALSGVIDKILLLSRDERNAIAEQIRQSIGDHVGLLSASLPRLRVLIGVTESPAANGPPVYESDYQFKGALVRLIKCFCLQQRPLVLFLDDMQWADDASLTFSRELLIENAQLPFLMVCAYRDNEVKDGSSVSHFLESIQNSAVGFNRVHLGPLNEQGMRSLINDVMALSNDDLNSLLGVIKEKTASNPFFVLQFINFLMSNNCISYQEDKFKWQVNFSCVSNLAITENVVDLVREKILVLPRSTANKVKLLACMGNKIGLSDLSKVLKTNENELFVQLQPAVNDSILIINKKDSDISYQFSHDRIQEAACELINPKIIIRLHKRLGERYLALYKESESNAYLFNALQHLNIAKQHIQKPDMKKELARLNLVAARASKRALAYEEGIEFNNQGLEFLKGIDSNNLKFDLEFLLCECQFLSGQGNKIDGRYDYLMAAVQDEYTRASVTLLYIKHWASIGDFKQALNAGISVLKLFGVNMPSIDANLEEVNREYDRQNKTLNNHLNNRHVSELFDLQLSHDKSEWIVNNIFSEIIDCSLNAVPIYTRLITVNMVNRGIENGHTPYASLAYVFHGMVMVSLQEDYELAYELGNLAVRLNEEKTKNDAIDCKLITAYATDLYHIKNSLVDSPHFYESAYLAGLEHRDHIWCSYSLVNEVRAVLSAGRPLSKVLAVAEDRDSLLVRLNATAMLELSCVFKSLVLALQNEKSTDLNNKEFSENEFVDKYQKLSPLIMSWYRFLKIKLCFLLGDYQAHDHLPSIDSINVHVEYLEGAFYQLIIEIKHDNNEITLKNRSSDKEFSNKVMHIDGMAKINPRNFLVYSLLIKAEKSKGQDNVLFTTTLYEQAKEAADNSGLIYQVGLVSQLAGDYFYRLGQYDSAAKHLSAAKRAYEEWGAFNIVTSLEKRYPALNEQESKISAELSNPLDNTSTVVSSNDQDAKFNIPALEELSVLIDQLTIQSQQGKLTDKMINAFLSSAKSRTKELSDKFPQLTSINLEGESTDS